MHTLSSYTENVSELRRILKTDLNFDIQEKTFLIGGRAASLFFIEGMVKDEVLEKLLEFFHDLKPEQLGNSLEDFQLQDFPYIEAEILTDYSPVLKNLLSGVSCLFVSGMPGCLAVDCRSYPARNVSEPQKDRTLRGSRDGFVETLVFNTALLRRRIRSSELCMEMMEVGCSSRTDIALCYMQDRADLKCLHHLKARISQIQIDALSMNQESLAELLLPGHWYNPFPKFHLTERPDAAAASILEGNIIILVDNSPSAMILPTTLIAITEEANDYYFPPVTGTYLRLSRMLITLMSLLVTPLFLLFMEHPQWIPGTFSFIAIEDPVHIPLIWQFLMLELSIDGLRLAAIHTPDVLSTPLSVIAGLSIGEFSVESGWFNSEVMLYMAFVAVANYTQPNFELGYALKFMRLQLLILTALFNWIGFLIGCIVVVCSICFNKTLSGWSYLHIRLN